MDNLDTLRGIGGGFEFGALSGFSWITVPYPPYVVVVNIVLFGVIIRRTGVANAVRAVNDMLST
jgi:hypothetical protein